MALRPLLLVACGFAALLGTGPALASAFDNAVLGTSGLLGYYPFTPASQANSVVNGYTGTLNNGAAIGGPGSGPPVNDPASSALVLANGASGTAYAGAGGGNPLGGGIDQSGSIVAWIKLASLPTAYGRTYSIAGESQFGNDLDLQVDTDNRIRFYTSGGGGVASTALTAADLNTWIFVAATFVANGERDIYLNGGLVGTDFAGGHSLNNAPFYQGQSNVFGNRYFDGSLSDVGLFNRALTAGEIEGLYAASFQSTPTAVPAPGGLAVILPALAGLLALRRRPRAA